MHIVLILVVCLWAEMAPSQVLRVDHFSLDVHRFSGNREPMTPQIPIDGYKGAVELNWDVSLTDYVKWDNRVYASGTYSKFTTVSWEYMVRVPTKWGIEPFIAHKSQHTMDMGQTIYPNPERFPVRDSIGVRLCFVGC